MTDYSDTVGDFLGPTPAQDASYGTFKGGVQKAQADHEAQLSRRAATPYGRFLDMLGTGMSVLPASPIARVGQMAPRSPGVPPPEGNYFQPPPVREIPPSNAAANPEAKMNMAIESGDYGPRLSESLQSIGNRYDRVQGFKDDAAHIGVNDPKQLAGKYQRMFDEDAGTAAEKMTARRSDSLPKSWDDAIGILQQRQQTVQDLFRRGLISAAQYQKLRGGK